MDEQQVAPPVASPEQQQPVEQAPPQEQAPLTQAAEQQLATIDPRFFAAYTQGQQKISAIASALGISKASSIEQFMTAIAARQQAAAAEEDELIKDPRYARRLADLRAHEERMAQQQFGDAAAIAATILETPRGSLSLIQLSELIDQALTDKAAARFAGANPAPAGGTQPQQAQASQGGERERNLIGDLNRGSGAPPANTERASSPTAFFERMFGKG